MSFILRLQNLPWSANAMDIRNFFKGLGIPDGGVHIVGGEIGDAFIAFSNDEDARQAMLRDGGKIKEVQVRLLLSSRTEMQKVIDTARLSSNQYGTLGKSSTAIVAPTVHIVAPTQIQPPVITSNLTGLVSKQMEALQSHTAGTTLSAQTLIQLKQQQSKLNALLMSNVNDASNEIKNDDRSSSEIDRKRDSDRRDRGYRSPRSRSRDRSKRSRTRSRSRDRLGRTRRRRSRSRERRNRPRRSSSRERSRSRERNSRDTKKELPNPWAVNPNPATSILVQNDAIKVQNIDDLRNPIAFQGNTGLLLPDNAPLFTTSSSLNKPLIVTNNFITSSYDQKSQIDKTDGRCVKISKMDRITGYGEIRRFFAGLQIHQNGIKMINDKTGRRTGVAYIRFARLEFKRTALLQSGLTLRDAKVEVTPLLDEDFDEAVDSFKPRYENYRRGGSYRSDDDDDDRDSDDDYYRKDRDRSRSRERERERSRSDRNRFKSRTDSDDDDLQIISNTSRDNNTDNDEDDVKLVSDSTKDSFTTLLIKDIPPFTKEQDIIKMFSNYTLVHILICKNVDGTKANYAYAKFHRAEDAKSALNEKACHLIAYRNVTVSRVSDDIYDKDKNEINSDINLLDSELQSSTAKQQTNIMMSNNIVKEEEKHEKTDTNTESNKVKMPLDPRLQKSQSSQNSYLMNQFDNSCNNVWGTTATQTTSSVWQMNNIGSGGISLMNNGNSNDSNVYQPRKDPRLSRFDSPKPAPTASVQPWSNLGDLSSMNNFTNILSNNDNNVPLIRDPRQRNTGTTLYNNAPSTSMEENTYMPSVQNYALQSTVIHSVVMSNLEPNISDRDVTDFFSEVGLIPQRVRFLSNRNGMPTGDCFCEFSTSEEARRALQKNNYHLGMNSIKIELIASDKMEEILASFNNDSMDMRNDPRNSNYNNNNSNSSNSNNSNNYRDRERGGNDNFRDRMNNNSNNNNMNNYRGNGNFRGGNNNNNSNVGRGFRGNNSMNRMNNNSSTNKMNPFNNNAGNNNNSNSKPPSLLSLPTPPLGISGPGPFNLNSPLSNNNQEFDKIGCVVSMENVPYRAGVDDILDFFNGFILDKQNIMRRYNDNGTPTGDARVCFLSPAEAKRAMEIKKYGKIFNRTIYLKLLDEM